MASYADLLRVVQGRFVHVGEVVALSREPMEVVSPAIEALIGMGTLRRLPDRRLTSTKSTLGELTKQLRDRGGDPNGPLRTVHDAGKPLDVVAELASGSSDGRATQRAKCPLCKTHFAAMGGDGYCPQCGAHLNIVV